MDETVTPPAQPAKEEPSSSMASPSSTLQASDYYFESYSHFAIHEEMLKDTVRTTTYQKSIIENPNLFKGKIVLDVGCGTGILSMFAAQAGAARVIALDCSSIIDHAKTIVEENGFSEVITLIKGKVEEVTLPVDKVDIIISEWMGYCLLYENMLESVLFARDKWLADDGILLPDKATMFLVGIEDEEYRRTKIDFWDSVYGFKMSALKKEALIEPLVDVCDPQQVMTSPCTLKTFDIKTVKKEDLSFTAPFSLTAARADTCHAIVAYFDVMFTHGAKDYRINTSPLAKYTHWKQTVFYLPQPWQIRRDEKIEGTFCLRPNEKNKRDMDIDIEFKHIKGKAQSAVIGETMKMAYKLR